MTASIGIAMFDGAIDTTAGEEVLVEADIAMYDPKEAGRNRAVTYDVVEDRQARIVAGSPGRFT